MVFCLKIFAEIGILKYEYVDNKLKLSENKNIHSSLDKSHTYNEFNTEYNKLKNIGK